jgi:DNA-directed RNA polymerase specialized sigma24 family protein
MGQCGHYRYPRKTKTMTVTEFVKQYHKAFVRAVKAYRISSENAEDLCQACYVQWLQRMKPLQITKPEDFIKVIAFRVAMKYRRNQNRQPISVPIDDMPDKIFTADTIECGLIRDEEFIEQYTSAKLQTLTLEKIMLHYILSKAKPTTILNLLIQYNSGVTVRTIAESLQINVSRVHKEIVQWRNWLKQFGES